MSLRGTVAKGNCRRTKPTPPRSSQPFSLGLSPGLATMATDWRRIKLGRFPTTVSDAIQVWNSDEAKDIDAVSVRGHALSDALHVLGRTAKLEKEIVFTGPPQSGSFFYLLSLIARDMENLASPSKTPVLILFHGSKTQVPKAKVIFDACTNLHFPLRSGGHRDVLFLGVEDYSEKYLAISSCFPAGLSVIYYADTWVSEKYLKEKRADGGQFSCSDAAQLFGFPPKAVIGTRTSRLEVSVPSSMGSGAPQAEVAATASLATPPVIRLSAPHVTAEEGVNILVRIRRTQAAFVLGFTNATKRGETFDNEQLQQYDCPMILCSCWKNYDFPECFSKEQTRVFFFSCAGAGGQ